MENQTTIVFIKPEAMSIAPKIKNYLARAGQIIHEQEVTLTKEMIDVIYPHLSPFIRTATYTHLENQKVMVYLIEGQLIIETILDFVGRNTDPMECSNHTIRRWCANVIHREPELLLCGTAFYYQNYVHRAQTWYEVVRQAKALLNMELTEH